MAFPGKYDISYYKGDTFEFRIYPKDTSGTTFNLNGYTNAKFTISDTLGEPPAGSPEKVTVNAYAAIDDSKEFILCTIRPVDGAALNAKTSYVYDIEISNTSSPYDYVYTLLSGTIKVTEQVTEPTLEPIPNTPGPLVLSDVTSTAVTCTWTAATSGSTITGYKIAVLSNPLDPTSIISLITLPASTLTYTFTGLTPATVYGFGVVAYNGSGDSSPSGNYTSTLPGA